MTGLRQLLHLVTKITVSHLRQLIHHCHWSVPCLCLLATAYPSARPRPCDEPPPSSRIFLHTSLCYSSAYLFTLSKKEDEEQLFFFLPTLHFYHITIKKTVSARHQDSYLRNLILLVITPLMCSWMRECGWGRGGVGNNICFWILAFLFLLVTGQKLLPSFKVIQTSGMHLQDLLFLCYKNAC